MATIERAVQIASVYRFTARDNLRPVGQHNNARRGVSYYSEPVSPHEKTNTVSLVFGHLHSLGTNFYVGATTSKSTDTSAGFTRRQNEVFVKTSWAFDVAALIY